MEILVYIVNILFGWALPAGVKQTLKQYRKIEIWCGSAPVDNLLTKDQLIRYLSVGRYEVKPEGILCNTIKHPTIAQQCGAFHYFLVPSDPIAIEAVGALGGPVKTGRLNMEGKKYSIYKLEYAMHTNNLMHWKITYAESHKF